MTPSGGPSPSPSLVPPQPNTPQEIQEAADVTKDLMKEMKRIFPKLDDYSNSMSIRGRVEEDGSMSLRPGTRSMEIETPNGTIEILMTSEDSLTVRNQNERLDFMFEGNYIRLDHNTGGGRDIIYEYNPYEDPELVRGSARQYKECVETFLNFMSDID